MFDGTFVPTVDPDTLIQRLDARSSDEFGGRADERELVLRLQRTGEDTPANGTSVDATAPLSQVVDDILRRSEAIAAPDGKEVPGRRG